MKAVLCKRWGSHRDLHVTDLPSPPIGPRQVRIAVHHATVGFGQTLVIAGTYQRKPPLPFVPGTEVSGTVLACGAEVVSLQPGDRVAAALDWGGYAEEAVASAATAWKVPDGVSLAAAAVVPLGYGTAYAALVWRAALQPADWLVVYGAAGGVGLAAVALGNALGARVIAVASSEARLAVAKAQGAQFGLLHGEPDLGKRIKAITGGAGAQIVFDPVGGALTAEALRCLAPEGRLIVIGFASGVLPDLPPNILMVKNIQVIGFNFGTYIGWGIEDLREHYAPRLAAMMDALFAMIASGAIPTPPPMRFPMMDFAEAFDAIVDRRSVGRVLLDLPAAAA